MSRKTSPRTRCERGFALVTVLWVAVILSLLCAGVSTQMRTSARLVRDTEEHARAQALAEAGVHRGLHALLTRYDTGWPLDGTPRTFEIAGEQVSIAIQDEFGRLDLNASPEDQLARLFESLGAPDSIALAGAIADWRDGDDLRRVNGAEAPEYRAAGRLEDLRNASFRSVEDLELVLGMTPTLLALARPALTVHAQKAFVDPATAVPLVRQALFGADKPPAPTLAGLADPTGRAFEITARVAFSSGTQALQRAVVRRTGNPARPYWILEWQSR